LADFPVVGIHMSFLLPVSCLVYILWFAVKQKDIRTNVSAAA